MHRTSSSDEDDSVSPPSRSRACRRAATSGCFSCSLCSSARLELCCKVKQTIRRIDNPNKEHIYDHVLQHSCQFGHLWTAGEEVFAAAQRPQCIRTATMQTQTQDAILFSRTIHNTDIRRTAGRCAPRIVWRTLHSHANALPLADHRLRRSSLSYHQTGVLYHRVEP